MHYNNIKTGILLPRPELLNYLHHPNVGCIFIQIRPLGGFYSLASRTYISKLDISDWNKAGGWNIRIFSITTSWVYYSLPSFLPWEVTTNCCRLACLAFLIITRYNMKIWYIYKDLSQSVYCRKYEEGGGRKVVVVVVIVRVRSLPAWSRCLGGGGDLSSVSVRQCDEITNCVIMTDNKPLMSGLGSNTLSVPRKISRATSPFSFSRNSKGKTSWESSFTWQHCCVAWLFWILIFPPVILFLEKSLGKKREPSVRFQMSLSRPALLYPLVHVLLPTVITAGTKNRKQNKDFKISKSSMGAIRGSCRNRNNNKKVHARQ